MGDGSQDGGAVSGAGACGGRDSAFAGRGRTVGSRRALRMPMVGLISSLRKAIDGPSAVGDLVLARLAARLL